MRCHLSQKGVHAGCCCWWRCILGDDDNVACVINNADDDEWKNMEVTVSAVYNIFNIEEADVNASSAMMTMSRVSSTMPMSEKIWMEVCVQLYTVHEVGDEKDTNVEKNEKIVNKQW